LDQCLGARLLIAHRRPPFLNVLPSRGESKGEVCCFEDVPTCNPRTRKLSDIWTASKEASKGIDCFQVDGWP
jgi:hypothetical protein